MQITVNINANSPEELREALVGLAGTVNSVTKPNTRTSSSTGRTSKATDPETSQSEKPETESNENAGSGDTKNIPTVVELRAKAQEKGKTPEDKKAIKALLDKFGSKSISDVPEDKRAAFLAALEEL